MLVNPITSTRTEFKSLQINSQPELNNNQNTQKSNSSSSAILITLGGLAVIGLSTVGLKKTSATTYEEALKKAGVAIKDNIATEISTGEKFSGKIERYETRNRKETVEFVNGLISEKIYHNVFGKELDGYFYKDGKVLLRVGKHNGSKKKSFGYSEYKDGNSVAKGDVIDAEISSVFDWARNKVKNG